MLHFAVMIQFFPKTMIPDVTAVVLTHNRPERCRDSIIHNARALAGFEAQILVFNNGNLPVELPETIGKTPCRIISSTSNIGIAAKNRALLDSNSEIILMLDDDAYIEPGQIDQMMKTFNSDPSIAAVSFRIKNSTGEEACLLPTVFHGCACGFRSDSLAAIGGFPEDFLYYGEEYCVTFRLYQNGYRIVRLDSNNNVFHARDDAGRNMNRIVRFLVRNNIRTWVSLLPRKEILSAAFDTLQRYAMVARKEKAIPGFIRGCTELPMAVARGLLRRDPMNQDTFDKIVVASQLDNICRNLKAKGIHKIVVCSVGKFPSTWLTRIRNNGLTVAEFWDTNSCWKNRTIHGIPVVVTDDWKTARIHTGGGQIGWISGTGSLAETDAWQTTLSSIGLKQQAGAAAEIASGERTFDLLRDSRITLYTP